MAKNEFHTAGVFVIKGNAYTNLANITCTNRKIRAIRQKQTKQKND